MDVQSVSTALAGLLSDLKIDAYDYGPDAPVSPCAFIYPESIVYQEDYAGDVMATFVVRFLVSATDTKDGQAQLNRLISPTGTYSAVVALKADSDLGGAVHDSRVVDMRQYGVIVLPDQGSRYYSAELIVEILA